MEGQGLMCQSEESSPAWKYSGQFHQNLRHGLGRCEWSDGRWYDGEWKLGLPDGEGEDGMKLRGGLLGDTRLRRMENGEKKEDLGPLDVVLKLDADLESQHAIRVIMMDTSVSVDDGLPIMQEEIPILRWGLSVGRPDAWTASGLGALMITRVHPTGPMAKWNSDFQNSVVGPNAFIWSVNDVRSNPETMLEVLQSEGSYLKLELWNCQTLRRAAAPRGEDATEAVMMSVVERSDIAIADLPGTIESPSLVPSVPQPSGDSPMSSPEKDKTAEEKSPEGLEATPPPKPLVPPPVVQPGDDSPPPAPSPEKEDTPVAPSVEVPPSLEGDGVQGSASSSGV